MAFSDPQKNIENLGLHEGSYVADLGAGSGFYTLAAARVVGNGGKIYSVDVQQDLLARIKNAAHTEHLHNIEVIHGNMEKVGGTRLRENSVETVLVCNVLFQIDHKDDFVNEVARILKSKGRVLIVDWSESFGGMGPQKEHVVPESEAKKLFENHKFNYISSLEAGEHHYGLVYSKA